MADANIETIKYLARRCAHGGLRLRDARFLFDAMYISDAIMLAGGNKEKAAQIAGVNREMLIRLRRRNESEWE